MISSSWLLMIVIQTCLLVIVGDCLIRSDPTDCHRITHSRWKLLPHFTWKGFWWELIKFCLSWYRDHSVMICFLQLKRDCYRTALVVLLQYMSPITDLCIKGFHKMGAKWEKSCFNTDTLSQSFGARQTYVPLMHRREMWAEPSFSSHLFPLLAPKYGSTAPRVPKFFSQKSV